MSLDCEDMSPPYDLFVIQIEDYDEKHNSEKSSTFNEETYWEGVGLLENPFRLNQALMEEIEIISACLKEKTNL